jgi:hypothetical protein
MTVRVAGRRLSALPHALAKGPSANECDGLSHTASTPASESNRDRDQCRKCGRECEQQRRHPRVQDGGESEVP